MWCLTVTRSELVPVRGTITRGVKVSGVGRFQGHDSCLCGEEGNRIAPVQEVRLGYYVFSVCVFVNFRISFVVKIVSKGFYCSNKRCKKLLSLLLLFIRWQSSFDSKIRR